MRISRGVGVDLGPGLASPPAPLVLQIDTDAGGFESQRFVALRRTAFQPVPVQ